MQTTTAIRSFRATNKCSSSSLVSSTSTTLRHSPLSLPSRQHQHHHQQNRHHHHDHRYRSCQFLLLIRDNCFLNRRVPLRFIGNNCRASDGYCRSSNRRSIFTISASSKNQETSFYHGEFKQRPCFPLTVHYLQRRYVASSRRTTKRLRVQPAPSLVPGGLNGASAAIAGVQYSDHIVFNPPSSMPSVYHTPMKFLPKNDPRRKLYESHVQALAGSSFPSPSSSSWPSSSSSSNTASAISSPLSSSESSLSPPSWIPSQYIAKAGVPAAGWTRYATSTEPTPSRPHPSDLNSSSSSDSSNCATSDNSPGAVAAAAAAARPSLPPMIRPIKPKKYHLTPADMDEMRRLRAEDPRTWTRSKLAEKFQCSNLFVGFVCRSPEMKRENEAKMAANRARWGRRKTEAKEDRKKRREMWGRDV